MFYIYVWLLAWVNVVTQREVMTCRECGRTMAVVFIDDLEYRMTLEFDTKGAIINFLGTFPIIGRPGVSELGYFDIQCVSGCQYRYADYYQDPQHFFAIENRLREIDFYRSGAANRQALKVDVFEIDGQIELF